MDILLIVLRLVHVVMGAVWVGIAVMQAFFLGPALEDIGPDAGKMMAALQRRGLITAIPILALLTLISGFWLYYRDSMGFQPAYSMSPIGMAYGFGGAVALLAFVLGMTIMRPSMNRAIELGQSLGTVTDAAERQQRMAEMQKLRTRGATISRLMAGLLLFTVGAMAVARYL